MTSTFYPTTVTTSTLSIEEIGWIQCVTAETGMLLNSKWKTERSLTHLSNPACGDLRTKTQALICTNFQITDIPDVITGISVNVVAQRSGRIVDETVQLTCQDQAIGKNNFVYITDSEGHLPIKDNTTYGGSTDLWQAEITPAMLQDPSFGVILKFQSHPYYPHRSGMLLNSVSLTVYG